MAKRRKRARSDDEGDRARRAPGAPAASPGSGRSRDLDPVILQRAIQAMQERGGNRAAGDLLGTPAVQRWKLPKPPSVKDAGQALTKLGQAGQKAGGKVAGAARGGAEGIADVGGAAAKAQPTRVAGRVGGVIRDVALQAFRSRHVLAAAKRGRGLGPEEVSRAERQITEVANAIGAAWDQWRMQATFRNVTIMAVAAIGGPGSLDGPAMGPLVAAHLKGGDVDGALLPAVSGGFGGAFDAWRQGVTVPGLPWYPAFAAFPAPQAPPMPNVPTPLVACVSGVMGAMTPGGLASSMTARAGAPSPAISALADGIAAAFTQWVTTQQVMGVMGAGPVPTFAPPYVPVGPVVGGRVIAAPGHLAS